MTEVLRCSKVNSSRTKRYLHEHHLFLLHQHHLSDLGHPRIHRGEKTLYIGIEHNSLYERSLELFAEYPYLHIVWEAYHASFWGEWTLIIISFLLLSMYWLAKWELPGKGDWHAFQNYKPAFFMGNLFSFPSAARILNGIKNSNPSWCIFQMMKVNPPSKSLSFWSRNNHAYKFFWVFML